MDSETFIPTCVGFILDGNRRWAKERNLPTLEGHTEGYKRLKETVIWCHEAGVQHVVAYVFSTEIQELIEEVHDTNPRDPEFTLWLAASYGGRSEILAGVNKLLTQRAQEPCASAGAEGKEQVTEEEFTHALWTSDMPDPDIIVRTGGQKRLSNFLAWSSGYSELFFLDTYWPAFSKEDLLLILKDFASRKRNFGK
ncbi:MAG: Isoprenyl transferase [Parcubacteria group bacterium GW2011_GWA2_43_11]|nr:MAG: Isoprenyl transferase [Parcubacteria group bacterium GW2011_GWA2_43_11]